MRLSVIVPALNEAARIGACLESVLAQSRDVAAAEMIVADGGSTDDTVAAAAPYARVVASRRGRGVQMNAGARLATGDVLLFLHADSRLTPGALAALRASLEDPKVIGGTFTLRFDRETALLRAYAFFTRFRWRLFHYGDQGIFVRRTVFHALGGFGEMPLMEDVDFLARLKRTGRTVLVAHPVTTSARRFERHGVVRQQLRNAMLLAAYFSGVSPRRLARWYENASR